MNVEWTTSELKEKVLVWFAVLWAFFLILPGNALADPSRLDLLALFANDTVWGGVLFLVSTPMLLLKPYKRRHYRKFAHAFYWIFWFGIFTLALARAGANGLSSLDMLISLPYLAIAMLHAVIYAGLWRQP